MGGVLQGLEHLAVYGHKKIAFAFRADASTMHGVIRLQAFQKGIADLGLITKDKWRIKLNFDSMPDTSMKDLESIFLSADRPSAIFFDGFYPATMSLLTELKRMGLRLPQDVSLIGFDDTPWTSCTEPALTVIKQPLIEIGRKAIDKLQDQINHAVFAKRELLPVQIVERDSVSVCKK
jgi:DNA-binding LacI/PurR family transcriptional regulator